MKKSTLVRSTALIAITLTNSFSVFAQSWQTTGNVGTTSNSYLGNYDNMPIRIRTNNQQRMVITAGQYGGLEVGSENIPSYIGIQGRDVSHQIMPFTISTNVNGQTWGNAPGQTMGRLMRFNMGASIWQGGENWYDLGIGRDTCFYITNHSIKPTTGSGVIRKRMIVISPQDRVGINLPGTDAIGTGALPTANFHTNGTVRLQNLPSGQGDLLKIDAAGNLYRDSSGNAALLEEIAGLKDEIMQLKELVEQMKSGFLSVNPSFGLRQNTPNPISGSTMIKFTLPAQYNHAELRIASIAGVTIKTLNVTNRQSVSIGDGELTPGTYFYSLVVDGKTVDTKKMALIR